MSPLTAKSPEKLFRKFKNHLDRLLHSTITEAPLEIVPLVDDRCYLQFQEKKRRTCKKIGKGYFLYVGQALWAKKKSKEYELRTLGYTYQISLGPSFDDQCIIRWEYTSRKLQSALYPRHHVQMGTEMKVGRRQWNLNDIHVPTGYLTIEEIIRFAICELGVKSKKTNWDNILRTSEDKFREWTGLRPAEK